MSRLVWRSGADGGRAVAGSLLRWREVPRGRWQYGFYRGADSGRLLQFSETPDGPIVTWMLSLVGHEAQVAVLEREPAHD